MTFPVQVGPASITINRDDRFLVCQPDGRILGGADDGFFTRDTRLISGYDLRINGRRPVLLNSAPDPVLLGPLRVHERRRSSTTSARSTASRSRSGSTGRSAGGVHEDLDIVNYARRPVRLTIEIAIDSDFADIFDVRARRARPARRAEHPLVPVAPASSGPRTTTATFRRELIVAVDKADSPAAVRQRPARLRRRTSPPKGAWHTCLRWLPIDRSRSAAARPDDARLQRRRGPPSGRPARRLPKVALETPNWTVRRTWEQAVRDLEALRLEDPTFERGVVHPGRRRARGS